MKKFTIEETRKAMKIAMKLKSKYAKQLKCKFNEVSLSICLKEAYKIIADEKKVKTVVSHVSMIFNQNDISAYKNGWNHMFDICNELNYEIKVTGCEKFTHKINCSKDDLETIKEMIKEIQHEVS